MRDDLHPPVHEVRRVVAAALAEDLGPLGDLTASLLPAVLPGRATFVPRDTGVLAGTRCATEVFAQLDPAVVVTWLVGDGEPIGGREPIGVVEGPLRSILTGERSALNFLCHLSGVATLTHRFVEAAAAGGGRARIWDTRKTLPGLRAVEKAAVRAGGGVNHRGNLSEFLLVKDNHLAGLSITAAVQRARDRWPGRTVEVECDRIEQVWEALDAGAGMVLLDNMTPEQVAACTALVAGRIPVEVSGGITLDTVADYAAAGADLISTSQLTQSAPAFDIGLDLGG
ncbi:MAG: carboxylating nicotinate-nucleotide diphosphorylase [Acidimicrobiales bacterium]|nr:carboxylating nicotinate-nucleotide diphosphorylase [Acidimicrobiales bacterium]